MPTDPSPDAFALHMTLIYPNTGLSIGTHNNEHWVQHFDLPLSPEGWLEGGANEILNELRSQLIRLGFEATNDSALRVFPRP